MHLWYSYGCPTATPNVFALGGGGWEITWSPNQVHPYAIEWLRMASGFGPDWRLAPPEDLWAFGLRTRPC